MNPYIGASKNLLYFSLFYPLSVLPFFPTAACFLLLKCRCLADRRINLLLILGFNCFLHQLSCLCII